MSATATSTPVSQDSPTKELILSADSHVIEPTDVLDHIRDRGAKDLSLSYARVEGEDQPLRDAAVLRFGSWGAAVEVAGLPDPSRQRRGRARPYWKRFAAAQRAVSR